MSKPPEGRERRGATRHELQLNVTVDGTDAVTENVSSSGVLLQMPADAPVGSEFTMDMEIPAELGGTGGRVRFRAEVVRVEDRGDGRAIAARFIDWQVVG